MSIPYLLLTWASTSYITTSLRNMKDTIMNTFVGQVGMLSFPDEEVLITVSCVNNGIVHYVMYDDNVGLDEGVYRAITTGYDPIDVFQENFKLTNDFEHLSQTIRNIAKRGKAYSDAE